MPSPSSRRVARIASASATIAREPSASGDSRRSARPGRPPRAAPGRAGCSRAAAGPISRRALAAARAEDLLAGADEVRHVLDDADDPHPVFSAICGGAHGDLLRGGLRRRHDHDLGARQELAERDRDVARARWHVDDERVELAPVDVGEELLERLVQHRAAPHHRRVVVEEEADRHQLQRRRARAGRSSCRPRPGAGGRRACAGSSARRRRRRARRPARPAERSGREVRGQRRLADAALAGRDGDHARRAVERDALRPLGDAAAEPRRQRRLLVGTHHVEVERTRTRSRRAGAARRAPAPRSCAAAGSRRRSARS